jgi:hypothetical protein
MQEKIEPIFAPGQHMKFQLGAPPRSGLPNKIVLLCDRGGSRRPVYLIGGDRPDREQK